MKLNLTRGRTAALVVLLLAMFLVPMAISVHRVGDVG